MRTRFRTGMALAMFSLIIFTMTFMAAMMIPSQLCMTTYPGFREDSTSRESRATPILLTMSRER